MYKNWFREIPSGDEERRQKIVLAHLDKNSITRPELDKDMLNWRERHHETYAPGHYKLRMKDN